MTARLRFCAAASSFTLALIVAAASHAQVPRGDGAQTGDGSNAFTGLAQAPEANLFAGSATTGVPILLPPGRKNLTPQLQLSYNSSGGPSPVGYGFTLPLAQIQRSTKHGVLLCSETAHRDEYVVTLPGGSVECLLEGSRCKPKIQESFLKILFMGGNGSSNRFEVWDKSGLHYFFGENATAKVEGGNSYDLPARTGSSTQYALDQRSWVPCSFAYTYSYALTAIEDTNGNRVDFRYLLIDGVLYPDSIQYGGTSDALGSNKLAHMFEVSFQWVPRADGDNPTNSMGGYPATLSRQLSRIVVKYAGNQVRAYGFGYTTDRIARQTLLRDVTLYGRDNQPLTRAGGVPASTIFEYQEHAPATGRFGFEAHGQWPGVPAAVAPSFRHTKGTLDQDTDKDVFDANGDGFPDLVDSTSCSSGYWRVFLGSRSGFATSSIIWQVPGTTAPFCSIRQSRSCANNNMCGTHETADVDGDGIVDFVDASAIPWRVYYGFGQIDGSATGRWGFSPQPETWQAPFARLRETDSDRDDIISFIDMNGDGLPDLVNAAAATLTGQWDV